MADMGLSQVGGGRTPGADQSPDGHLTQAAWTVLVNTDRQNLSCGSNYL